MKKIFYIILISTLLAACDKVYINGELDGMWRLEEVVYPDSIVNPELVFYSFQRHMTQISKHNDTTLPIRFLGNLHYNGNTLAMSHFYSFPHEQYAATVEMLKDFHLYNDSTVFQIITLDSENLIMKDGERRYTLSKW